VKNEDHTFQISVRNFFSRRSKNIVLCTVCNNAIISGEEVNLFDFIQDNYNGKIIRNDRKVLEGKELDIYLPDLNLAFEYNGIYWHDVFIKAKDYHELKTKNCFKKGIELIHIYENDWEDKNKIVKSFILNKLNVIKEYIDVLNCKNFINRQ
jgi:hypothetical protein